jgi:hypothetical protein
VEHHCLFEHPILSCTLLATFAGHKIDKGSTAGDSPAESFRSASEAGRDNGPLSPAVSPTAGIVIDRQPAENFTAQSLSEHTASLQAVFTGIQMLSASTPAACSITHEHNPCLNTYLVPCRAAPAAARARRFGAFQSLKLRATQVPCMHGARSLDACSQIGSRFQLLVFMA